MAAPIGLTRLTFRLPAWGTLVWTSRRPLYWRRQSRYQPNWCVRSTNAETQPSYQVSIEDAGQFGGNIGSGEPINPEGLVWQVYVAGGPFGYQHEQKCLPAREHTTQRLYQWKVT